MGPGKGYMRRDILAGRRRGDRTSREKNIGAHEGVNCCTPSGEKKTKKGDLLGRGSKALLSQQRKSQRPNNSLKTRHREGVTHRGNEGRKRKFRTNSPEGEGMRRPSSR